MSTPCVALWGTGGLAQAYAGACRSLDWPIPLIIARSAVVAAPMARALDADAVALADLQRDRAADIVIVAPEPRARPLEFSGLLQSGHHVIATPLLAGSLSEADEIVTLSDRSATAGQAFLYADHLCIAPVVQRLLALLRDVGTAPTHLSSQSIEPVGSAPTATRRASPVEHHGAHGIAVTLLAARISGLGRPTTVVSQPAAHDELTDLRIGFARGPSALVHASWGQAGAPVWDFQVATPTAVLRIDLHPSPVLERNGEPVIDPTSSIGDHDPAEMLGFAPLLRGFWADITAGIAPVLPAAFGRDVVEIVAAAHRSAARHEPVDLPLDDRPGNG